MPLCNDTRHTVFQPARLRPEELEAGYWRAYENFYRWGSILKGAWRKEEWPARLRHFAYAAGWKKFEFLWNFVIRTKQVASMLPVLESVLEDFGRLRATADSFVADAHRADPTGAPAGRRSPTAVQTGLL